MRRAFLLFVAAVTVASGLAWRGPALGQTKRDAAVQSVLDERVRAVKAKDRAAFLSTIDSNAREFAEAQGRWFDRIGSIQLADYALSLETDENPDLVRRRDRERYDTDVMVVVVEEKIRIDGFDERAALHGQFLTFVRRGEAWLIASDRDLEDLGLNSARHPWDFGEIQTRRSEHFLIIFHPSEAASADALLALAEQSLADVDRIWRSPWSKRTVIYVPSSSDELEKLLDATVDVDNFVAFATGSVDRNEGWNNAASRVILNPGNFLRFSASGQRSIFAHELLHIATRIDSGPHVNLMVEEGLAQLAEPGGAAELARVARAAVTRGASLHLPEDLEFVSGSSDEIGFAYHRAFSALTFLRTRFGVDKLGEFYKQLGGVRIEPGTGRYHFEQTLRKVFGLTVEEFEREWVRFAASSSA
jgi:hypothetical protein